MVRGMRPRKTERVKMPFLGVESRELWLGGRPGKEEWSPQLLKFQTVLLGVPAAAEAGRTPSSFKQTQLQCDLCLREHFAP